MLEEWETMCIILIAEDDKDIRQNLNHLLSDEGYKVFIAINGVEAYTRALNIHPDIILSDVKMPFMNGFELFKKLKANPGTSSIPFIFLTAENKPDEINDKISEGAVDFLSKPFNITDLLNVIKTSLKKRNHVTLNLMKNPKGGDFL